MIHNTRPTQSRIAGFTLLEVMIAMGIFIVAFSMIYAMLPAAILIQKQSIDKLRSLQMKDSVEALVKAKKFNHGHADFAIVTKLPLGTGYGQTSKITNLITHWPVADRSMPSQLDIQADDLELAGRRFFWVPLYRNENIPGEDDASKYALFVFLMRRGEGKTYDPTTAWASNGITNAVIQVANDDDETVGTWNAGNTVPKVCQISLTSFTANSFTIDNTPLMITIGDKILDSNGNDYMVIDFGATDDELVIDGYISAYPQAPTHIWFAPPADQGGPSPTLKIIRVEGAFK